jgi:hypothetical protein
LNDLSFHDPSSDTAHARKSTAGSSVGSASGAAAQPESTSAETAASVSALAALEREISFTYVPPIWVRVMSFTTRVMGQE